MLATSGHDCCSWAIAEYPLARISNGTCSLSARVQSSLRWGIETLSVWSPIFRRKKCLGHSKTENGLSDRGVTGSWAQSIWTSTKQDSSNNSGKLVMAGEKLWASAVGSGPPWWSAPGRMKTATRQCQQTGPVGPVESQTWTLQGKNHCLHGKRQEYLTSPMEDGRISQPQQPWPTRRSSAACGTVPPVC